MKFKLLSVSLIALFMCSAVFATDVSLSVSGKGAVNDSTVIAGEPFTLDMNIENDMVHRGFTLGLLFSSENIKKIIHVADSGNGMNDRGDIKAFNGWQDKSIWDLNGLFVVEANWEGDLPDTLGLGGICVKQEYKPHDRHKVLSIDLMVPSSGTLVVDSSFFPPSGIWVFVSENGEGYTPGWGGPYKYNVVSKEAASKMKPAKATKEGE